MPDPARQSERRSSARKTALVLAVIAFAIYGAFIMSGVIGR
jgi:hypothetical protein